MVDDVGSGDQFQRDLHPLRSLEIERDRTLAALAAEERLARETHAVAGDRLHLDHVRAEVAHDHRPEGTGQVLPEVQYQDTAERTHQAAPPTIASSSASE